MSHAYLIPIVMWLPPDRRSTMILPQKILKDCLVGGVGRVCREWVVYSDGEVVDQGSDVYDFQPSPLVDGYKAELSYDMPGDSPSGGYLECTIRADNDATRFKVLRLPGTYNIHSSPTRKSFFTCHTHKFASPPVISQIARFGQFVDCYPVITVDKINDRTTSLVFVNPYGKNIVAKIFSRDGRKIEGVKLKPRSVCRVDMAGLLLAGEDSWGGHIQLTANNRALTWLVKHRISDPRAIATAEHLDPYRADETHMPLTKALRNWVGHWLERRQARAAHRHRG